MQVESIVDCRSIFISRQNTRTIAQCSGLVEPRLLRYVLGIFRFWKIDLQKLDIVLGLGTDSDV